MNVLVLNTTNKSIEILLGASGTTNQLQYTAHYADATTTSFTEGSNDGLTNNTTAVTMVAAPAASTQRIIREITVYNADTVAATITVRLNSGGSYRIIHKGSLAVGDTWALSGVTTSVSDGDKGDITVSGGTWTIDSGTVNYSKIQNVTDARILGRSAGSSGIIQEISVGAGLSLSSGTIFATGTSGGGDMVLIASTTLGVDTASIDFTSIPGTYKHLHIRGYAKNSSAGIGNFLQVKINNDSGANYDSFGAYFYFSGAYGTSQYIASATCIVAGANGSGGRANAFSAFIIDIPAYANTTGEKDYVSSCFLTGNSASGDPRVFYTGGHWRSTSAINRLTFSDVGGGNLKVGTMISLYGMN